MSIKVKVQTILQSQEAIAHLLDQKLPVKASYRLTKTMRVLTRELQDFEDARVKIARELANGGKTVPPEKIDEYQERLAPLMDEEVLLEVMPITVEMIADIQLSLRDMMLLDYLIEEVHLE